MPLVSTFCLKLGVGISAGLLVWEHVAKTRKSSIKPSIAISWVAESFRSVFYKVGALLSRLSSFVTYLNLGGLIGTIEDLLTPIGALLTSPLQFFAGYVATALKNKQPIAIALGSAILLVAAGAGWHYGGHRVLALLPHKA